MILSFVCTISTTWTSLCTHFSSCHSPNNDQHDDAFSVFLIVYCAIQDATTTDFFSPHVILYDANFVFLLKKEFSPTIKLYCDSIVTQKCDRNDASAIIKNIPFNNSFV